MGEIRDAAIMMIARKHFGVRKIVFGSYRFKVYNAARHFTTNYNLPANSLILKEYAENAKFCLDVMRLRNKVSLELYGKEYHLLTTADIVSPLIGKDW